MGIGKSCSNFTLCICVAGFSLRVGICRRICIDCSGVTGCRCIRIIKSFCSVNLSWGAILTASTAISLLPKDWANPLANSLADMNKYFIFIFAVGFG